MFEYFVDKNQRLTPTTLLLTLKKDTQSSRLFSFQPGQYAAISFKHRIRPTPARCFSIVSSPTNPGILQFSMRTKGHFTKALTDLKEGDEVKVRGPFGGFVFDPQRDAKTVLLAGGIGITPFMSMLSYAADTRLANKITLIFSCQSQDDVPFLHQLIELQRHNPNFESIFVISDGPTDKLKGQTVTTGRITPKVIDSYASGSASSGSFFICGPPPFMKAMNAMLHDRGVPGNRVMTEAFSQGPNRQTGKIRSWPYNIYALSALGVALGSFVVMVGDLFKTLPPSSVLSPSGSVRLTKLTNSRQTDLDALVNNLPALANSAPATAAASKALQASNAAGNSVAQTTTPAAGSAPVSPAPVAASTPAPVPAPKCTTTQSGVTTCV